MNTKINIEALKQVTGGRGYDRDDDPKHKGESNESDFTIRYGVPLARWFVNSEVGRWVGSIIG